MKYQKFSTRSDDHKQDFVIKRMTVEDFNVPLLTKLYGTKYLSEAFAKPSLDFFIMLSSLSGIVGSRGQANYAAGNTFQDAFAQSQRKSKHILWRLILA